MILIGRNRPEYTGNRNKMIVWLVSLIGTRSIVMSF